MPGRFTDTTSAPEALGRFKTTPIVVPEPTPITPVATPVVVSKPLFPAIGDKGLSSVVSAKPLVEGYKKVANKITDLAVASDQGIARSVGTVGVTAGNAVAKVVGRFAKQEQPAPFADEIPTSGGRVPNALFGGKPIRTLKNAAENAAETGNAVASKIAGHPVAPLTAREGLPLAIGGIVMDLSGFGGAKAIESTAINEIPEVFFKTVAKENNPRVIEALLSKTGLDEANAKALGEKLASTKTVNEAKDVLANHGIQKEIPSFSKESKLAPAGTPQEILAQAEKDAAHLGTDKPVAGRFAKQAITPPNEAIVKEALPAQPEIGTPPAVTPPELPALAQEARKYKSADEFVNSKIKAYHGTPNGDFNDYDLSKAGSRSGMKSSDVAIHLAENPKFAKSFAGKGEKATIKELYLDIKNPLDVGKSKNVNAQTIAKAKSGGYDSIISDTGIGKEYTVFSPEQMKTKAQLTDFYNNTIKTPDSSLSEPQKQPVINQVSKTPDIAPTASVNNRGTKDINQLYNMLSREEQSLAAARANPVAHAKAYGPAAPARYEAKIAELKAHIEAVKPKVEPKPVSKGIDSAEQRARERGIKKTIDKRAQIEKQDPLKPISFYDFKPPEVRGGLAAPELDLPSWKDKAPIRLNRETFDRNIRELAPKKDYEKVKEFVIDPIKNNETERVRFINNLRIEIRNKINKLGIKKGSDSDALIQKYGEKKIDLFELKKLQPTKWKEIVEGSKYFRKVYDDLLDKWNKARARYDYPAIPKRDDYFRHFQEIQDSITNFGLNLKENALPTELNGLTETFKPGKPFSTTELRREGDSTKFSAIGGMDNWLNSTSKAVFHTDSVQRLRAIEKYIREAAKQNLFPAKNHLSNLTANIMDTASFLAGKKGRERFGEGAIGRGIYGLGQQLQRRISANFINFNVSSALTNFISILTQVPSTTAKIPFIKGMLNSLKTPFVKDFTEVDSGINSDFLVRRFPEERITNTTFENVQETGRWLFQTIDKFAAHATVASKYYELVSKGVPKEQAIKIADDYASKVLAERAPGQMPNLFEYKQIKPLTAFQLEVNNLYSFLKKDVPEMNGGNKLKIINALLQFAVYSYLFNNIYEKVTGRRPTFDPINYVLTATGLNEEGKDMKIKDRLIVSASDFMQQVPGGSLVIPGQGARIPIGSSLPNLSNIYKGIESGNGKMVLNELEKPVVGFASPIGGGAQAKKTVEGLLAVNRGFAENNAGNPTKLIEKTPLNAIKASLFGPSATTKNADGEKVLLSTSKKILKDQNSLSEVKPDILAPAKKAWDEVKKLGVGTPEADAVVEKLTDSEYNAYKLLKSSDVTYQVELIRKILPIVQQASNYGFGSVKADALVQNLSDQEYEAYTSIKSALKNTDTSDWSKQTFLDHVSTISQAWATSPQVAFDNLIHGDWKIVKQLNGQIIVKRMPEYASEAIKKKTLQNNSNFKLDHTIPLEIGGTNRKDNLQILSTGDKNISGTWAGNTAVENYLGDLLSKGRINGTKAREYIIRYKKGVKEPMSSTLEKEYVEKYGGIPITLDQIKEETK